jgi:hypothetical protein
MQQSATQIVCYISSIFLPSLITIRITSPLTFLESLSFYSPRFHQRNKGTKLTYIPGPLDDLLTNIQGGLDGGLDFLSIPSGDGAKKVKRAEDIPGAASKCSCRHFANQRAFR